MNSVWKPNGLSSNYYITCSGEIYALVSEDYIATHAGCNNKNCIISGMNNISLGVDLQNCLRYGNTKVYTIEQQNSLNIMLKDFETRNIIKKSNDETIVGHFEIRKTRNDPLIGFNWLYTYGIRIDHRLVKESGNKTPFQIALNTTIGSDAA